MKKEAFQYPSLKARMKNEYRIILAAFVFKLSVPVVYVILMSDEIIKIPITYKRYRSYKWLNDVTR